MGHPLILYTFGSCIERWHTYFSNFYCIALLLAPLLTTSPSLFLCISLYWPTEDNSSCFWWRGCWSTKDDGTINLLLKCLKILSWVIPHKASKQIVLGVLKTSQSLDNNHCSQQQLTLSPSSPGEPAGPAGPGRPTGPCTPSRPAGPWGPFSPCFQCQNIIQTMTGE